MYLPNTVQFSTLVDFVSPANCHQPETRAVGHPCNPLVTPLYLPNTEMTHRENQRSKLGSISKPVRGQLCVPAEHRDDTPGKSKT
jgi:hypothetical protein